MQPRVCVRISLTACDWVRRLDGTSPVAGAALVPARPSLSATGHYLQREKPVRARRGQEVDVPFLQRSRVQLSAGESSWQLYNKNRGRRFFERVTKKGFFNSSIV